MALTGLVLVGFVTGHMLGNLQIFLGADAINAYAYKLHNLLPGSVLWAVRLFLLANIGIHIWMAVSLTLDNRRARPVAYANNQVVQASYSSRTMRMSGIILLAFIIFHIAHFTVRACNMGTGDRGPDPTLVPLVEDGEIVLKNSQPIYTFNVNDMMVAGFRVGGFQLFM